MTLAAQGSVRSFGGLLVSSSALGLCSLTGKSWGKLPWVLHLCETINASENRTDLRLKIRTLLFFGYTEQTCPSREGLMLGRVKREKTAGLFFNILGFC